MSGYAYAAYGMTFQVPFPCPGLRPAESCAVGDVVVEEGPVPRSLGLDVVRDEWCEAEPGGRFLLKGGPRAGRFLVQDGRVTVERDPGADDRILARLFTAPVLAAVLRQRGMLVLHANVAVTPSGVVVIAGRSGAGKSTAAAALLARGCALVADDITALRLAADGRVEALPGTAEIRLTAEAAKGLGYELGPEHGLTRGGTKAALPTGHGTASAPGRLRAIYLLDTYGLGAACYQARRCGAVRCVTALRLRTAVRGRARRAVWDVCSCRDPGRDLPGQAPRGSLDDRGADRRAARYRAGGGARIFIR